MPTYVALLRAVNVGGRNLIGMSGLRAFAEQLRFNRSPHGAAEREPRVQERRPAHG